MPMSHGSRPFCTYRRFFVKQLQGRVGEQDQVPRALERSIKLKIPLEHAYLLLDVLLLGIEQHDKVASSYDMLIKDLDLSCEKDTDKESRRSRGRAQVRANALRGLSTQLIKEIGAFSYSETVSLIANMKSRKK